MPKIKIEAPEGVQMRVRLQRREDKASVITEQGFDGSGNPTMVSKFGPKVTTWPDQSVDVFASETREYDVDAENRIVVEVQ